MVSKITKHTRNSMSRQESKSIIPVFKYLMPHNFSNALVVLKTIGLYFMLNPLARLLVTTTFVRDTSNLLERMLKQCWQCGHNYQDNLMAKQTEWLAFLHWRFFTLTSMYKVRLLFSAPGKYVYLSKKYRELHPLTSWLHARIYKVRENNNAFDNIKVLWKKAWQMK